MINTWRKKNCLFNYNAIQDTLGFNRKIPLQATKVTKLWGRESVDV